MDFILTISEHLPHTVELTFKILLKSYIFSCVFYRLHLFSWNFPKKLLAVGVLAVLIRGRGRGGGGGECCLILCTGTVFGEGQVRGAQVKDFRSLYR